MSIQQQAIKSALKKMFQGYHFDICTIRNLLDMTGSIPNPEVYRIMQTQHCVNYSEMDKELRDYLYKESIKMFIPNGFDLNILDAVFESDQVQIVRLDEKPKSFLRKLLSS